MDKLDKRRQPANRLRRWLRLFFVVGVMLQLSGMAWGSGKCHGDNHNPSCFWCATPWEDTIPHWYWIIFPGVLHLKLWKLKVSREEGFWKKSEVRQWSVNKQKPDNEYQIVRLWCVDHMSYWRYLNTHWWTVSRLHLKCIWSYCRASSK